MLALCLKQSVATTLVDVCVGRRSEKDDDGCGERMCGTKSSYDHDSSNFEVQDSKLHGKGLFTKFALTPSPRKPKMVLGRFGGVMECGECVRNFKKENGGYDYKVIFCDMEEKDGSGDVAWHLRRTGDESIDGPMWWLNEARDSNDPAYRTSHVEFISSGLASGGFPKIECVLTTTLPSVNTDILTKYGVTFLSQ